MAAGRASRLGRCKATIDVGGESALARLARVFEECELDPIVVVASGEALDEALDVSGVAIAEGDPDAPMIDSIAHGIDKAGLVALGAIIQPIDAPFTTPEMIAALLAGDLSQARVLAHGGVAGHPAYVPRALFDAIRARPEGGLRVVLEEGGATFVPWSDERVLADIDTPEDLARWLPVSKT